MRAGRGGRVLLVLLWSIAACTSARGATWAQEHAEDFDAMQRAIDASYAYPAELAAWRSGAGAWRARAAAAPDTERFIAALEGALDLLHEDPVTVALRGRASPRRVPAESDVWARFEGSDARIEAVAVASDADMAGLRPGQIVTRIQGVDIARAVDARLGEARADPHARDWALRHLLAGPRHGVFTLEIRGEAKPVRIEHRRARAPPGATTHRIGEARDLGYIRLDFRGGRPAAGRQLDIALHALAGSRALILDLRDTEGPASDDEMRSVLSRFVRSGGAWRIREARGEARVVDEMAPVPSAYAQPLVVLVDRWTAGEAESLAIALRALGGATLVGTRMAGLRADPASVRLPHSGIVVRFPARRVFAPDGAPRESVVPDVPVDLSAPSGGPGDPILYQALKRLERPAGG